MFQKVLIANRGAIACRIERTLKNMQIGSVAVYAQADEDSLHVSGADEAVFLGKGTAQETYLNQDAVINAAKETGAEAIHPGYGFLSEHAGFAERCRQEGIVFIGPDPEHMNLFGKKHSARELAAKADVPLLEGTDLLQSKEEAVRLAKEVGYPLMLKSTAGGGGIGMRVCYSEQELLDAYDSVLHLAESNFSDGGMFLEAYIEKARHIEVQIFGTKSETISLLERDCSTQRRNQKVIEETPAPGLSEDVRARMLESAETLARTAGYRSAGTVEFLYDDSRGQFYFLEMNTRLQVEHGVTEEIFGVDLVQWMIEEAAGTLTNLKNRRPEPSGHSIQARVYAEDCQHDFRPSAGLVDRVVFSKRSRNETWLTDGVEVTTLYDPMLAKVIVTGKSRDEALEKLDEALSETKIYGITTNIAYIRHVLQDERFTAGSVFTKLLDTVEHEEPALEVIDGGVQTTIQDYPGRTGYWGVGVPPSGAMDPLAFRIGNALLGNTDEAPGMEMTLEGGTYRFRTDVTAVVTGADMQAELDGENVAPYTPFSAKAGSMLKLKKSASGMRTYLLVTGGFDVPKTLGSASTFTLGQFGGHSGRALRTGDVIGLAAPSIEKKAPLAETAQPQTTKTWTIGVIPGPHCTAEFLEPAYLKQLEETEYEVHFNSSRTGVRLMGPAPLWARDDGGEAGLHPSNIHDNAYAVGTLDLTGDMPILLGPDGPSLGGFVCPVTTASAEFWKLGQLAPGDKVRFQLMTLEEAEQLRLDQEAFLQALPERVSMPMLEPSTEALKPDYPLLVQETDGRRFPMTIRASGDRYLLVEYGDMELDLKLRFQAHALMQAVENEASSAVVELTPGIRSLQIGIDPLQTSVKETAAWLQELDHSLPPLEDIQIQSRIVRLPLSWDDPQTQLATERYAKNVRPDAPWCPDNLEFIRRINGLDSIEDVKNIVFDAKYLVMGLGDVYLGAPVAVPVDPRQRLVTTKYNPARTWTPENAVGIGGSYLCIYGMEGPGGYQFVGRTVQMWNRYRQTDSFRDGKPWLLRFFDQIEFYPVSSDDLMQMREDFPRGRMDVEIEATSFALKDYLAFVDAHEEGIASFKQHRNDAFQAERMSWKKQGIAEYVSEQPETEEKPENTIPDGAEAVRSSMPGSIWKVEVAAGDVVAEGDVIAIQESMKMEFPVYAPAAGTIVQLEVKPGDEVQPGQLIGAVAKEEVPVP
ncbi:urea carboxylase [Alkalicoccus luteus]|uniref:Urea carboxylase n=1 Tax=Alkalicoccus luteus TaxID=1237094 RepID=A0A969PMB3_9BACI|nr:urea carboxylase [Alkalicoccus luteus]NJP36045.1 urea carboxylase [Alkalicoccus luteus]